MNNILKNGILYLKGGDLTEELKQYCRPEFLNRLDEIIVFRQLTRDEVKEIAEIMLKEVFSRIEHKGIKLTVSESFKERLVEEGYNPAYGARPLRRAVMRLLEDSLAEEVLSGRIKDGDEAEVDIDDKKKKIQESYNEISFVAVQDFSELQIDLFSNMDILYIDFDGDSLNYTREFDAVFVHFPNIIKKGESAKIKVWYFISRLCSKYP